MRHLLLHGFTGTPESFSALRVPEGSVIPTLGGHAGTPVLGDFWQEVERLASLGKGCDALCGYSLGGRFALGILARYSERFRQTVIVSAQPGLVSDAERASRRDADARFVTLLRERGLEAFVDAWQALPLWASQGALPEAVKQSQRTQRLRHSAEGLAQSLLQHGLGEMPDLRPFLAKVQSQVSLVVGERDPKFVAFANELATLLPNARVTLVTGAGHNLLLERPELCSDLLALGAAA